MNSNTEKHIQVGGTLCFGAANNKPSHLNTYKSATVSDNTSV